MSDHIGRISEQSDINAALASQLAEIERRLNYAASVCGETQEIAATRAALATARETNRKHAAQLATLMARAHGNDIDDNIGGVS